MCIVCEDKDLLEFYKDKIGLLKSIKESLTRDTQREYLPELITNKVNETIIRSLHNFSEVITSSINSSRDISQEMTKSVINDRMKDLEYTIESKAIKNKFTPSVKGAISEDNLFQVLSDELHGDWEVTKTTTSGSKKGDIFLENSCSKIIIDLKDYSTNIPISQVEKIKRDMTIHSSHGFLVSVNTNISRHKDYSFELVNNKILAYISRGDTVTKIKSWVNLILSLEKVMVSNDLNTLELTEKDIQYIYDICKDYDYKISGFKVYLEDNIKKSKEELSKLSSKKNNNIFLFLDRLHGIKN